MTERWNETWYQLREWTDGSAKAEALAGHLLVASEYSGIDPSHPHGGPDGGRDITCSRDRQTWIAGVYFPRGEQSVGKIKKKFLEDLDKARTYSPAGFVFVTNQEMTLGLRSELHSLGSEIEIDIIHLERASMLLDQAHMAHVRSQFLVIETPVPTVVVSTEISGHVVHPENVDLTRDRLIEFRRKSAVEANAKRAADSSQSLNMAHLAPFVPHAPRVKSPEILTQELDHWASRVESDWPKSIDYLLEHASPGLIFTVRNDSDVYIETPQIKFTIPGVRGLRYRETDEFDFDKMIDPFEAKPEGPFPDLNLAILDDVYLSAVGSDLEWENGAGGVEVTVNLPALRPKQDWSSGDDHMVLIVEDDIKEASVSWTLTAKGHHTVYRGADIIVPVRAVLSNELLFNILERQV